MFSAERWYAKFACIASGIAMQEASFKEACELSEEELAAIYHKAGADEEAAVALARAAITAVEAAIAIEAAVVVADDADPDPARRELRQASVGDC